MQGRRGRRRNQQSSLYYSSYLLEGLGELQLGNVHPQEPLPVVRRGQERFQSRGGSSQEPTLGVIDQDGTAHKPVLLGGLGQQLAAVLEAVHLALHRRQLKQQQWSDRVAVSSDTPKNKASEGGSSRHTRTHLPAEHGAVLEAREGNHAALGRRELLRAPAAQGSGSATSVRSKRLRVDSCLAAHELVWLTK